jgi:hypothetical protein
VCIAVESHAAAALHTRSVACSADASDSVGSSRTLTTCFIMGTVIAGTDNLGCAAHVRTQLWTKHFWSVPCFADSCGGALAAIIED